MTDVSLGLWAVLAPLAIAALLLAIEPIRRMGKLAAGLSVLGAVGSLAASTTLLARWWVRPDGRAIAEIPWLFADGVTMATVGVQLDGISVPMLFVVSLVATCVQIFSLEYMSDESSASYGRYFTWQSLFLFSMQGLVVAPNLMQLFVCWELVGLCSYLLIGFFYRKASAGAASLKAFWITKLADLGLLLGLIVQYVHGGSFGWDDATVSTLAATGWALPWVAGLYFVAVMGKSAQFPLHVWLPDAMEGPTPVSALLHAATMVAAGVFLIVRAYPIFVAAENVMLFMAMVGGFTAIFAACLAIVQTDIKKVLAYSTCSQLGYMIAALGAGSLMGGYFHLTTHAFFKALLFLAAGSIIHAVHSNELTDMGGLRRKMPLTSTVFIIGAAALAGLPMLSGFFSKDIILEALLEATHTHPAYWFPLITCSITVLLTAYYMMRVVVLAFFGPPSEAADHAHEGGWAMRGPLVLLAVLAVVSGYGGGTFEAMYGIHDGHFDPLHVGLIPAVGTVLAVIGLAIGWWLHAAGGGAGLKSALAPLAAVARSGAVDKIWWHAYRGGALVLASATAWFDRYIIDGLLNAAGVLTLDIGQGIRRLQTGKVNDYVYAVVGGALILLVVSQTWAGGI